jgi:hypothetical protein
LRKLLAPLVLGMAGTLALSGPVGAQVPTEDSVIGTANVTVEQCFEGPPPFPGEPPFVQCFSPNRYIFDVHSGSGGENPRGTVIFATGERQGLALDTGAVTCLAVSGNRAGVGVNFPGLSPAFPAGQPHAAIIFVEDNGGEGQDRLAVQDLPPGGSAPSICPDRPPAGVILGPTHPRRFTDESVTVTDAPSPHPTSKEQCKNGGWSQFGFKNQGQCIRFVGLIPGPPPYPTTKEQCRHGGWAQYGFKNKRKCLRFVGLRPNP